MCFPNLLPSSAIPPAYPLEYLGLEGRYSGLNLHKLYTHIKEERQWEFIHCSPIAQEAQVTLITLLFPCPVVCTLQSAALLENSEES